jgi:hypothetical protein
MPPRSSPAALAQEQSVNRRVEIRMRPSPPTREQMKIVPQKAEIIEEAPTPKALLVKPQRALPVEEAPQLPKATPVEEARPLPRATPVEQAPPPRAQPAFPEIQQAVPVDLEEP